MWCSLLAAEGKLHLIKATMYRLCALEPSKGHLVKCHKAHTGLFKLKIVDCNAGGKMTLCGSNMTAGLAPIVAVYYF